MPVYLKDDYPWLESENKSKDRQSLKIEKALKLMLDKYRMKVAKEMAHTRFAGHSQVRIK